jgi:hypothetical protein
MHPDFTFDKCSCSGDTIERNCTYECFDDPDECCPG